MEKESKENRKGSPNNTDEMGFVFQLLQRIFIMNCRYLKGQEENQAILN